MMGWLFLTMVVASLVAALAVGWAVIGNPSIGEFADRPLCWINGHVLDRYLCPTRHEGRPAHVWRCSRCNHPVTVIES